MINPADENSRNRRYTFLESRSGETVPAIVLSEGNTLPLHSMVDPKREAQRLVSIISEDTGFIIFLGLGGGFAPDTALKDTNAQVIVIDFHKDSITELLSSKDYSALLNNERFRLLTDPSCGEIKKLILENYNPSLCGNIKTIPLRPRIEQDIDLFENAAVAIQEAIGIVSSDYSVQAHFGIRWFSNIIHNIKNVKLTTGSLNINKFFSSVKETAIVAAGPSLDQQIHILAECKHRGVFVISTDTAIPVLLRNGIKPDTVVSIDCQHISYYHFIGCNLKTGIPLVLDIASPPLLSGFSSSPVFFSSDHPLARYVSAWQSLPPLDTSGGNVTYACLSLAEYLGADRITLFGADFSYVGSKTYAKGTYIYPFFEKKQNRFSPAQSLFSAFLYRSPFLPKEKQEQNYRETASLKMYRKKFEEKAATMSAQITAVSGQGAPISLTLKTTDTVKKHNVFSTVSMTGKSGIEFLEQYRKDIAALPAADDNYLSLLSLKERQIFTTLLPCLAAIRHRRAGLKTKELIEETKHYCIQKITSILKQKP